MCKVSCKKLLSLSTWRNVLSYIPQLFWCLAFITFICHYVPNKPQLPNHSPSLLPAEFLKCPFAVQRLRFISASHSTLNWAGTIIQLDVAYFSTHTPIFWAADYAIPHQRPPFLKKRVFSLAGKPLFCTTLDPLPAVYMPFSFLILAWRHQSLTDTLRAE